MKHLYSLLFFFLSVLFFSQTIVLNQPLGVLPGGAMTGDRASKAVNGDVFSSASSFVLNQSAQITKITIYGASTAQQFPALSTGLQLLIYTDNNGEPAGNAILQTGTPIITVDLNSSSPAYQLISLPSSLYEYHIDFTQIPGSYSLNANTTYWIYFVAKLNLPQITTTTTNYFAWYNAAAGTPVKKFLCNIPGAPFCHNWISVGNSGSAFKIEGINELGTEEIVFDSSQILIYPNPTQDLIHIRSKENIKSAKLYDASGKLIKVKFSESSLNISHLPTGNYFLHIETETAKVVNKLIKN